MKKKQTQWEEKRDNLLRQLSVDFYVILIEALAQQKASIVDIIENMEWEHLNCNCNMCYVRKKTIREAITKIKELNKE